MNTHSSRAGLAGPAAVVVLAAALVLLSRTAPAAEVDFDADTWIDGEAVVALLSDKDPLIRAVIPGRGDGVFIVDTAAQVTLFDQRFVERLGLPLEEYAATVAVSRGDAEERELRHHTRVERLMIGTAIALDLTPPVLDLSHIHETLAGIIGQDILHNWVVLFDAPRKQLRILPAGSITDLLGHLLAPGAELHKYPVTWVDRVPRLTIAGEGDQASFDLVIDTGATGTSLPSAVIESQKLEACGTTTQAHIAGRRDEAIYRLGLLDLGKWRVTNLLVGATDLQYGLLGYNVLREFVFVVDGPGEAVYLMYHPSWKYITD